jgi:adenylate cyclase
VAMDESSIHQMGSLPWPRSTHGQLLDKLAEARVVAFDLIFNAPTDPSQDEALAQAIDKHGRVVLASQFYFEQDDTGETLQVFQPPMAGLMSGAAGLGFANMPTDPDKVVRRSTLVDINTFEVPFPSLGLATFIAAAGLSPLDLELQHGKLIVSEHFIPLNHLNQAMPGFWGPQGTFKTYSYYDVVNGKFSPAEFKDKIVLVGITASAEKEDIFATPYTTSNLVISGSLPTPGVEIHAAVVQSFLSHVWFKEAHPMLNLAILLLAAFLAAAAVSGRGPWLGLAGALVVILLVVGTAFGLWWYERLWVNVAAPGVLVFLTYAGITASDYVQAEIARRRTRAMFARYVSPEVVEELMSSSASVGLGGRRQTLTIMFCDIRGFTAYSENKAPEQVVKRLNEYLTAMTEIIFRQGGTLDKYLGDGLMAFFGAPVYYPDHIQRAIQAAIDIQIAVERLNKSWADQGEPPLYVGVGINSGSVLVGNVGSPERMDYTVIGEDVNLASRVEGLTKTFGELIVISGRAVRMLEDEGIEDKRLRRLGQAEVKGFTDPIEVYTVVR